MNSQPDGARLPFDPGADIFAAPPESSDGSAERFEGPESTNPRRRALTRAIAVALACLGATVLVFAGLTIAIEQHRQTGELENQTCYTRAAALAQVAAVEVARGSTNPPEPGLLILECDKGTGFEP